MSSSIYDFPGFDADDFSPVNIKQLPVALDEMSQHELHALLPTLRYSVIKEQQWQEEVGYINHDRLITIAEMYQEAQNYYAEYNDSLKNRINSSSYVPVLRLNGKVW